ncbi:MAG: oxidoreductase [Thiotrichaceae bacterium]|nr:oxidoreductase [Thiotrichaceae bacterium]
MFKAILLKKTDQGFQRELTMVEETDLMEGDVTINVEYSTINYKDALAITDKIPIVRHWPMVPGIDFAGVVAESSHASWQTGDKVILNGWGVGEVHWGGFAEKARVNGDWLIKLPDNISAKQAMSVGTAGYTAMLCILKLQQHGITPNKGKVLVTGASGGVGSIATRILSNLGYEIIASTKPGKESDYVKSLGAKEIIDRAELSTKGRPLGKERWIAAVDCVGSHTLANVCAGTKYGGIVSACGLAQGMDLPATVAPFILRGITLAGIDSVYAPKIIREEAWINIAKFMDLATIETNTTEITLDDAIEKAVELIEDKLIGRVVVNVKA